MKQVEDAMGSDYFQWDSELLTGEKVIDAQHYSLVRVINQMLKLSFSSELIKKDDIDDLENKLKKYIRTHFKTELNMMKKYNVDMRHVHKHEKLHDEFIDMINKFFEDKTNLMSGEHLSEIIEFLVRWLAYHILNTDLSLVRQITFIRDENLSPSEAFKKDSNHINSTSEPLLKALKALFFLVNEKNKELEQKNQELEEKVQIRTAELRKANEMLHQSSMTDELTGISNRRFAMEELDRNIYKFERYQTPFTVLFIDLNKFKEVNDIHGHDAGDAVLKCVVNFLQKNIRQSDVLCRIGGDEFIIICPYTTEHHALELAQKLISDMKERIETDILAFWMPSFSIGIAEFDDGMKEKSELLNCADAAMYESKKNGGNTPVISKRKYR